MAFCVWMSGDHERAVALGQRALDIAQTLGDVALQVRTGFYVGQAFHAMGNYGRSIDVLNELSTALDGELRRTRLGMAGLRSVFCRTWLVWCLAESGAFAEGNARGEEGVQIAQEVEHPFSLAVAYVGLGFVYLRQGHFQRAISVLERDLEVCETWHIGLMIPWASSMLGAAYGLAGRLAEAQPLLQQAVEQAAEMGILGRQPLQMAWLGEVHLLAGRLDAALTVAQPALALARVHQERGHEAWTLRLLGEIAAQHERSQVDQAEAHCQQALALAEELGMRPLQAHCHRGLGTLYARIGRREQAQAALSAAINLYRAWT
jgi:tetratricopeptide (TPR) repeat protein